MIYGYIRVSTDKQTVENQRWEIEKFCSEKSMKIEKWVEETISARKALKERKLGRIIKKMCSGDMLIASELSRIGRNLLEVMSVLNYCVNSKIIIWTIKDNFRLDTGIQSKVIAFAFGLAAEIEKNLISQRTKEALASRKAKGMKLGRPAGRKNKKLKLTGKEEKINKLLAQKTSKTKIARLLHVHRETLSEFLKRKMLG